MNIKIPIGARAEVAFAFDVLTGKVRFLGVGLGRDYSSAAPYEICGTADLAFHSTTKSYAYIRDYKTGHGYITPAKDNAQIKFLTAVFARLVNAETGYGEALILRSDLSEPIVDRAEWDKADLDSYLDAVALSVGRGAGLKAGPLPLAYVEGPQCRYCRSWVFCPAKTSAGTWAHSLGSFEPREAYVKTRELERLVTLSKARLKEIATIHGAIDLGGGKVYGKNERTGKFEEHRGNI